MTGAILNVLLWADNHTQRWTCREYSGTRCLPQNDVNLTRRPSTGWILEKDIYEASASQRVLHAENAYDKRLPQAYIPAFSPLLPSPAKNEESTRRAGATLSRSSVFELMKPLDECDTSKALSNFRLCPASFVSSSFADLSKQDAP